MKSHDQQALDKAEEIRRPSPSFLEYQITLQHADLVDPVLPVEEIEQICLVVSVEALADGLIVRRPEVQEPIALGVKVGVETKVLAPGGVPVVIYGDPRNLDSEDWCHSCG